jgi:PAS domain S-box-containing protein
MSARRAAEQALAQSEAQLRSLIGSTPGIAYRVQAAPGWPVLDVSEAVEGLTGFAPADFIGEAPRKRLWEMMYPEDRDRTFGEVAEAVRERRPHLLEFRVLRRDGQMRWLWSNGRASYDGRGRALWVDGVLLDITERKEAELAVQRFQSLVESSGDAIFSSTLDGVITSWNRGAETIFGYTALEAIGARAPDLLANPAAPHEPGQVMAQVAAGRPVEQYETRRRRKDGALIDVSATVSPILGPDGGIVGASMIARDITGRRRMEADLRAAKEVAERAAESRSAFLANMSHEIRTPMNAVLGFTDVLLQGRLSEEQRRHLDTIRGAGRSLLRLLNEVLDVAKLDRGAMELEPADFNLLSLIDHLTSTLGHQAQAKGLMMQVHYAAGLPRLFHGDEMRVRQILINLLGNAIKFTASGSVTLSVTRTLEGALGQGGAHGGLGLGGNVGPAGNLGPAGNVGPAGGLHFIVRDTGIGIAPERLAVIFDPFTQADASMSRRYGGTGLGTTIAKQL